MKKLNPVQKQKYQSKLKEFEIGYSNEDIRNKLGVHFLSGDKAGKLAFTCLKDKDRNDRVIFTQNGNFVELDDLFISLDDIGTHDEVYG